jgi:hypothetical protein
MFRSVYEELLGCDIFSYPELYPDLCGYVVLHANATTLITECPQSLAQ